MAMTWSEKAEAIKWVPILFENGNSEGAYELFLEAWDSDEDWTFENFCKFQESSIEQTKALREKQAKILKERERALASLRMK